MLESSKDLLYIVIAFCVLWFTIVLCWMIYYVAMLLREIYRAIREVREKISRVELFFDSLREKLEQSSYHLVLLMEGVKKLVDLYQKRRTEGGGKRDRKNVEVEKE